MLHVPFNRLIALLRDGGDAPALVSETGVTSFGALGRRVAAILAALPPDLPDGPLLVRGHKEEDVVAAMIAATCAGRGFVFAEADFPPARATRIARTCGCALQLDAAADPLGLGLPCVSTRALSDRDAGALPDLSAGEEERLFYVTFTSGSTGTPKGIPITRANFASLFGWMHRQVHAATPGGGAAVNHASMAFDMAMSDIWIALLMGRPVHLLDHARNANPQAIVRHLSHDARATPATLMSTPAFLAILLESSRFTSATLPRLGAFWVGGDEVPLPLLRRLRAAFPEATIFHAYGPSEVTCVTHCHPLGGADLAGEGPLPLGPALGAMEVFVDAGEGVPRRSGAGEIVLVGPQVAGRYLPADHPSNASFGLHRGLPSYRTGDHGTLSAAGELHVAGRIDRQVKLNGLRVELGAIEQCALEVRGIAGAVAVLRRRGVASLTLIVGGAAVGPAEVERVRAHLATQLPPYMVPARVELCAEMPLTLSGKVDRRRLEALYP